MTATAFPFRMPAGFPGDVNRKHPASIEPCLVDASAPPTAFGQAVVVDPTTEGVRPLVAGDSALTTIYGVTVRPFPFQASTGGSYGSAVFGAATPQSPGAIDVLRDGYIMVQLNAGVVATTKGGAVFIWVAATSGAHIQGGFETAAGGGSNTVALDPKFYGYNGPADAAGNIELYVK